MGLGRCKLSLFTKYLGRCGKSLDKRYFLKAQSSTNVYALNSLVSVKEVLQFTEGLETPIQIIYLCLLVVILSTVLYIFISQLFVRIELGFAAKKIGEKVRGKHSSAKDYFEMGAVLMRMKLYTQALQNLDKSIKLWSGESFKLSKAYNAKGIALVELNKLDSVLEAYQKAVNLQPGYTIAWNNMGSVYEKKKNYEKALVCYRETLTYDKENSIAIQKIELNENLIQSLGN